ncbi:MAG: Rpn family recombination-promoting nuclease/putative transposase [Gammaproteobacteria bacterium]|nr:Rpn family recombination-promoting nuclease/putative transposase [Gammaproteobacteria bacterium]
MHDPIYRRLFAFPRMVADLLRAVGEPGWIDAVDFGALEDVSAQYVGDGGQQRRGDAVWRVRFRNRWLYLLLLLEFQSTIDPRMALRNIEYTALLYRELGRRGELGPLGEWPPVLPLVLYNGSAPWTARREMRELIAPVAPSLEPFQPSQRTLVLDEQHVKLDDLPVGNLVRALAGLEQSRTPVDVVRVVSALRELLQARDAELGRAFVAWIRHNMARMAPAGTEIELGQTLEEATVTLAERWAEWPKQWHREGVAEGRREGVAEGRREGVARDRELLCRQVAVRFGSAVGERTRALLAGVDDWDCLSEVGDLVVRADTGADFLQRLIATVRAA